MREELEKMTELFIENRDIMKKSFAWDHYQMHYLCAYLFACKNQRADVEKIKQCKKLIRDNTRMFSSFRDLQQLSVAASMSIREQPQKQLKEALRVFEEAKERGFRSSSYLAAAAMMLAEHSGPEESCRILDKAGQLYQEMKDNHPFLTSKEDYGSAVMLAMSDLSIPVLVRDMEECYRILKVDFFASDAVQSLSHVLALSTEPAEIKCRRTVEIYNALKANKCKFGTGYELAVLGILTLVTENIQDLTADIVKINEFLLNSKGFGVFGASRAERVMYAASLAAADYTRQISDLSLKNALSVSVVQSIEAMQTAIIAATMAAAATSAASSGTGAD